jgi:GNAT superfamily N-acetyltransferase
MHEYLKRAYWSEGVPFEVLERAVDNSLCIGASDTQGEQVGLARFISDCASFCYVCDLYALEEHRRRGIAAAMLALALEHPRLQGLRRWNLVTRDAHELYRRAGFKPFALPQRHMERTRADFYVRPGPEPRR